MLPDLQHMPGVSVPHLQTQQQNRVGCLPVQYKEGVNSLMEQAQLVGQAVDVIMGINSAL